MFSEQDSMHMQRALELASTPVPPPHPNPRVGCVVTNGAEIVGEGFHEFAGAPHAEAMALKFVDKCSPEMVLYATLEPCNIFGRTPPCVDAILAHNLKSVVVCTEDPNPAVQGRGLEKLKQSGINVRTGLLSKQAVQMNRGYFSRHNYGRPWVVVKVAVSLDGRTALRSGESRWITGDEARLDVQRLRAEASAILTGSGTVHQDDPRLNCRLNGIQHSPLRVVADSRLSISENARLLNLGGPVLLATTRYADPQKRSLLENKATVLELPESGRRVDCGMLMKKLAELEINHLLVEAGPTLVGSLLAEKLVDEFVIYIAPSLLGDTAKGIAAIPELSLMDERTQLEFTDIRQIGKDIRVTACVVKSG